MRILVVQESDWLDKGPHQSHHLMERLTERGHEVKVIDFEILWRDRASRSAFSGRRVFKNVHKATDNGSVTVIRPSIIKLPILEYLSLAYFHRKEILQQIRGFKPDVVVGFGILNAYIAIRLCTKFGIPFVYYLIDELHRLVPQKYLRGLARLIERANMMASAQVLSINEGLRQYTIGMGAVHENATIIRAGVDLERFRLDDESRREIRTKYGFNDSDIVLFFMGWLYEFSGLGEVALELTEKRWRDSRIKMLILGEGELWDDLCRIRDEGGLADRIILEPWRAYSEVPKYVLASDICILPAHKNEIMMNIVPIKMYEYLAAGRPVIATNLPGLRKEFGEESGIVYVNTPEETILKACQIVENDSSEELGRRARCFVESNSWDKTVRQFEEAMERAIWRPVQIERKEREGPSMHQIV